jgi:hypothetical protein
VKQQMRTLKRQLQVAANAHGAVFKPVWDEEANAPEWTLGQVDPIPVFKVSITVGEILYNLRAALDYIVYELAAIENNGKYIDGTQFPIDESADYFESHITGLLPKKNGEPKKVNAYLRTIPAHVIERLRSFQPFAGCKWTRLLRELSNPDKHRHLTELASTTEPVIRERTVVATEDEGETTVFEYAASVEVLFVSGEPVVETLEMLHREVTATIDLFKSMIYRVEPGGV